MSKERFFSKDEALENYQPRQEQIIKALCLHVAHDCNMLVITVLPGQGLWWGSLLMDLETGKSI